MNLEKLSTKELIIMLHEMNERLKEIEKSVKKEKKDKELLNG